MLNLIRRNSYTKPLYLTSPRITFTQKARSLMKTGISCAVQFQAVKPSSQGNGDFPNSSCHLSTESHGQNQPFATP